MIDLQIGRRNLSIEEESYYRGLKYNSKKGIRGNALQKVHGGDGEVAINIAENLAQSFNVTSRTIKNDGKFADGMSKLSQNLRNEVLQGVSRISRKDIQALANLDIPKDIISSGEELKKLLSKSHITKENMSDKSELLVEIQILSLNLNSFKNCDLLIDKIVKLKSIL